VRGAVAVERAREVLQAAVDLDGDHSVAGAESAGRPFEIVLRSGCGADPGISQTPQAVITGTVSAEESVAWLQGALGELHATLAARGLLADGPAGGIYTNQVFTQHRGQVTIFGQRDTADTSQWRTEIGWPIFRTASP